MAQIKYYKGTQKEFDRIIGHENFKRVEKIYICEDGGIYFVLEDKKKRINLLDFWKKKGD